MSVLTFDRTGKLKPPHWYKEGGRGGGVCKPSSGFLQRCLQYFDSLSCALQVKVNIMGYGAAGGP